MIDLPQANIDNDNDYEIEAIVSFDDRGQLVLPKDVRKKFKLTPGEKLALVSCQDAKGELCCFTLVRTKSLKGMVKSALGPMIGNMT